jgi:N4-(beta-N-acetylglucosaminyl)-L-asparaginase
MSVSRRDFLSAAALASLGMGLEAQENKDKQGSRAATTEREVAAPLDLPKQPVIICKPSGGRSLERAHRMLREGSDTLDAAISVATVQEDDPEDDTVGLGGLPNEEGVVELDACVMHGPTRRAGAVGGVRNIKNVALLSKAVMEHTGHVMLVAEGAERFAAAMGFAKENLLTERSRKIWLLWKETQSNRDWWGPGLADPSWKPPAQVPQAALRKLEEMAADFGIEPEYRAHAVRRVLRPPTGTIHVSCVNQKGEMSGCTTTSGLAWKIPGRLGDSPIIAAGCYTDQDVGSAGATGSGEENIKVAGAHTIVENMRHGMSPREAGLDTLRRIARNHNHDMNKLRYLDMVYYILRKDGAYAGVSLWSGTAERPRRFAVHDGTNRVENTVALFQGTAVDWPPVPKVGK